MTEPVIVLCPGQGAQYVGMGRAWAEKSSEARGVYERADSLLGHSLGDRLSQICFGGPVERLNQTDVSQPAIFATSIACWRAVLAEAGMAENDVRLHATAGLSLGEYTALVIAGAISFDDGLELVALRGRAMQEAAEAQPGGMVAIVGADETQAQEICEKARQGDVLVCANFNAPGQVVLSGHKVACERAAKIAVDSGFRATMLAVAGAFHSPLMQPAADRLNDALRTVTIASARCPVVSNVTAVPHAHEDDPGDDAAFAASVRSLLVDQLTAPVRWSQSCQWMARQFAAPTPPDVREVAPGKTLAGLMRRIEKALKVVTHDEP